MRFLVQVFTLFLVTGLSACATLHHEATKHDNDYLKQDKSVAPTKLPPNLSATEMQTYYPIPPVTQGLIQQPSIVPPGSQLAQRPAQQMAPTPAPVAQSPIVASSNNTLVLNLPFDQAWKQVGKGLRSSGYKVMQQDKSLGAYFILDLAGSGGKLKANTPIYQLHLKPSGPTTLVTLYNDKGMTANAAVGGRVLGSLKRNL